MDKYFEDHTSILVGDDIYIWVEEKPDLPEVHDSPERQLFSSVGVFNVMNATFVKRPTTGTPPNGTKDYGCCCVGDDIYFFGGQCRYSDCYYNDLSVLNTASNKWRKIPCNNGPMKKSGCGMIPLSINGEEYILVIGGWHPLPRNLQSHAQCHTPHPHDSSDFITNEVHIMCVSTTPGKWTAPMRTGSVFPPLAFFSINTLPGNRAIIFGGLSINEHNKVYVSNDVFIVSYTNTTIDFQRLDHSATNVPRPEGRCFHSSVVISSVSGNGEEKPYLLVLGGFVKYEDGDFETIADCWVMKITNRNNQWKQISLPEVVTRRYSYSMSCYNMSDHCKWLTVFGGGYEISSTSPNRLMIVELVFSPTDDNWTVTNVLNEEDMKNTTNYTKLVSDRLSLSNPRHATADLSSVITADCPTLDRWDYGVKIDVNPGTSSSGSCVAIVNIFTNAESFTLPKEYDPVSAVYSISLSDPSARIKTIRIQHCVSDSGQLNKLSFMRKSSDPPTPGQWVEVPGGTYSKEYGEISPPAQDSQSVCSALWCIVGCIQKLFRRQAGIYKGMVLYVFKSPPSVWLMQLFVTKQEIKNILSLKQYIKNEHGHQQVTKDLDFSFTFEKSEKPKLIALPNGIETIQRSFKCDNGWEIAVDVYEISQKVADSFKNPQDTPGRCRLEINSYNKPSTFEQQPVIALKGIDSDVKDIRVNPPVEAGKNRQVLDMSLDKPVGVSEGGICWHSPNVQTLLLGIILIFSIVVGWAAWKVQHGTGELVQNYYSTDTQTMDNNDLSHLELLGILRDISLTNDLETFCVYLGLDALECNTIVSRKINLGDYEAQRLELLKLWGRKKPRTIKDLIVALDGTGYCAKARELLAQEHLSEYTTLLKHCHSNNEL